MPKYVYRLYSTSPQESIVGDFTTFQEADKVREQNNFSDFTIKKIRLAKEEEK